MRKHRNKSNNTGFYSYDRNEPEWLILHHAVCDNELVREQCLMEAGQCDFLSLQRHSYLNILPESPAIYTTAVVKDPHVHLHGGRFALRTAGVSHLDLAASRRNDDVGGRNHVTAGRNGIARGRNTIASGRINDAAGRRVAASCSNHVAPGRNRNAGVCCRIEAEWVCD